MKKIQCTGCGQVFWAELQIDESLISSGEWIQNPCPKCGAKWAVLGPAALGGPKVRRSKQRAKSRGRARRTIQAKAERTPAKDRTQFLGFSPAAIRKLRKKLGISQKKLASLVGVSTGAVVGWESGKFRPRGNKAAELSGLEKWEKGDIGNLLQGKERNHWRPEEKEEIKREEGGGVKRAEKKTKKGDAARRISRRGA